jgi:hypothetical protein
LVLPAAVAQPGVTPMPKHSAVSPANVSSPAVWDVSVGL